MVEHAVEIDVARGRVVRCVRPAPSSFVSKRRLFDVMCGSFG